MADDSESTKKTKKVMVAIDESDCSRYALQWALENLHDKLQSSGLVVFTSIPVDFGGIYAATYGSAPIDLITAIQENQKNSASSLLERAKELCAKYEVDAETFSVMGNPKQAICDAVEKLHCQLLIMGNHGRGAIERAFLGSVSNYCVHNAKCPVLVVKQPGVNKFCSMSTWQNWEQYVDMAKLGNGFMLCQHIMINTTAN